MEEDRLIVGDCECGCGCNEVALVQEHQPDVILFDEYGEQYQEAINETLDIVKKIDETTESISGALREHHESFLDYREEYTEKTAQQLALEQEIKDAVEHINIESFEEATQSDIEQMFDGEMLEDDSMWLPSMNIDAQGDVRLNIDVDAYGNAVFVD